MDWLISLLAPLAAITTSRQGKMHLDVGPRQRDEGRVCLQHSRTTEGERKTARERKKKKKGRERDLAIIIILKNFCYCQHTDHPWAHSSLDPSAMTHPLRTVKPQTKVVWKQYLALPATAELMSHSECLQPLQPLLGAVVAQSSYNH